MQWVGRHTVRNCGGYSTEWVCALQISFSEMHTSPSHLHLSFCQIHGKHEIHSQKSNVFWCVCGSISWRQSRSKMKVCPNRKLKNSQATRHFGGCVLVTLPFTKKLDQAQGSWAAHSHTVVSGRTQDSYLLIQRFFQFPILLVLNNAQTSQISRSDSGK